MLLFSCTNTNVQSFDTELVKGVDDLTRFTSKVDSADHLPKLKSLEGENSLLVLNHISLIIHDYNLEDSSNIFTNLVDDTLFILGDYEATLEGKKITVINDYISNLKIEQGFENTAFVGNEEMTCMLKEWLKYVSPWKSLPLDSKGQIFCAVYEFEDYEKFPNVSIGDYRNQVRSQCGLDYYNLIKNNKSVHEYPGYTTMTSEILRVTGQDLTNGKAFLKFIIFRRAGSGC
jgi:hypothetical protein